MKKLSLVIGVLVLLAAAGLAIFIATFDADRYRPQLVQKLEQALGRPVQLDRLRLAWTGGVAIQLQGLRIADTLDAQEPLLAVESANAVVRLAPLLQRKVQIAWIVLKRPQVRISRDARGRINMAGLAAAAAPAAAPSAAPAQGALGNAATAPFEAEGLRIEDGAVHWVDAAANPPVDMWLRRIDVTAQPFAPPRPLDVEAQAALGSDRQNLRLSGELLPPGPGTSGSLEKVQLAVTALPLEQLAPPAAANGPRLQGRLSAALEGSASTLAPESLPSAATASGTISIDEPVIKNLNIVRTVFEKMAILPGLIERLTSRLPPDYQKKFEADDTVLEPIELTAVFEQGLLRLHNLSIQSDTFGLSAPVVTITRDGAIQAQPLLRIDRAFSDALIRSVEELRGLANANGELEIPLIVSGKPPHGIRPDLQYIGSRIAVNKAIDALGEWLGHGKQPESAPSGSPAAPQPAPPTGEELLGQFLRRALTPKTDANSSQ